MRRSVLACVALVVGCVAEVPPAPPEIEPLAATDRQTNFLFYLDFWFMETPGVIDGKAPGVVNTQALSFVGREDLIVAVRGANLGYRACEAQEGDPVATIVERARETSIVIINEAHDSPRDRHFIGLVAEALRPLGYATFAAETFNNGAELNHDLVYVDDGFYSSEPVFGRMLGMVKALGYELVAYEQTNEQGLNVLSGQSFDDRIARRETAQVENLMAAIFDDDPDHKVLIHVGYGHVSERAPNGAVAWMAERLAAATGKDPLTISQTDCIGTGDTPELERWTSDYVDMVIGQPPLSLIEGRPAWRVELGEQLVPVPEELLDIEAPTIFEVRPVDAYVDTVPVDRLLLEPGERLPFLLTPGSYRIDMLTPEGRTGLAPTLITVE